MRTAHDGHTALVASEAFRPEIVVLDLGMPRMDGSASKNQEKRVAFNRMVKESAAGDFKLVVCYDAARFTRFENLKKEGDTPKKILRSNGVILDTVKEGFFYWDKPEGRWNDQAYAENSAAAALNLSKDSNRGRVNVLGLGFWPVGCYPYGYDRNYSDGVRSVFVRRAERYSKGRKWHCRLVVNDAEAAVVNEVFDLLVNKRWSRRQIAAHLNERGVPPPVGPQQVKTSGLWNGYSVLTILKEKAYVGITTLGHGRKKGTVHNRIAQAEQPGSCPPIVDPVLWHQAQEVIRERLDAKTKPQTSRGGILSGFLLCGHCGYRLSKHIDRSPSGKYVTYNGASASRQKSFPCKAYRVREDALLPQVSDWLVQRIDAELLASLQISPPTCEGRSAEEEMLEAQVKALEAKVTNGQGSALLAPATARAAVWAMVTKWREDLESAKQKLALLQAVRNAPELEDFKGWWDSVKPELVRARAGELVRIDSAQSDILDAPRTFAEVNGISGPQTLSCGETFDPKTPKAYGGIRFSYTVDKDRLRALLARLGLKVRIWWEKKESRASRREVLYRIKDVHVEATVSLNADTSVTGHAASPGP